MISILIPAYNFNCTALVNALCAQGRQLQHAEAAFRFEIVLADDASDPPYARLLSECAAVHAECRYVRPAHNLGRSAIRNLLLSEARYDHALLLDCDAEVCSPHFLQCYWDNRQRADAVCGTLRTPPSSEPGHELRYRYERQASRRRDATRRNRHPYEQFSVFNALLSRRVFSSVRFDERCRAYGYEDALYGLRLRDAGFTVCHIDNPLIHSGIDTNADFLLKTETALHTLRALGKPLQDSVGAARVCRCMQRLGLLPAFRSLFLKTQERLRENLTGSSPSLFLFKLYKAGFYSTLL